VHENRRLESRTRDEETEDKSPQTRVTHRLAVAHTLYLRTARWPHTWCYTMQWTANLSLCMLYARFAVVSRWQHIRVLTAWRPHIAIGFHTV
jgi:hypothetical protein